MHVHAQVHAHAHAHAHTRLHSAGSRPQHTYGGQSTPRESPRQPYSSAPVRSPHKEPQKAVPIPQVRQEVSSSVVPHKTQPHMPPGKESLSSGPTGPLTAPPDVPSRTETLAAPDDPPSPREAQARAGPPPTSPSRLPDTVVAPSSTDASKDERAAPDTVVAPSSTDAASKDAHAAHASTNPLLQYTRAEGPGAGGGKGPAAGHHVTYCAKPRDSSGLKAPPPEPVGMSGAATKLAVPAPIGRTVPDTDARRRQSAPADSGRGTVRAPRDPGVGSGLYTDPTYFPGAYTLAKHGFAATSRGHDKPWAPQSARECAGATDSRRSSASELEMALPSLAGSLSCGIPLLAFPLTT